MSEQRPVTPVLAAEALQLALPGMARPIFSDVDLRVGAGELVGILGPSGSGKSSLLRVLAGLRAPSRGQVNLHGAALTGPAPEIALAFQAATLLPWLSVEDNVALGLRFQRPAPTRAERRTRARAALDEVGLGQARALRPRQLSGGMAQRAALARCLVRRPEVLLLDEPFSALDEITRAQLQELLLELVRAHAIASVLVTHDIDEALLLCDRILVLGGEPARLAAAFHVRVPQPRARRLAELAAARLPIMEALARVTRARPGSERVSEPLPGEPACAPIR